MILRITSWSDYQHYKDRNPPWIKLHYRMLSSKAWVMLNDSERVLAVASMLIASQSERPNGEFDADPEYFRRVAYLGETPNFKRLIDIGFFEVVQADASEHKQMLAEFRPETETETETETDKEKNKKEKPKNGTKRFSRPKDVSEVRDYCEERKNNIDPQQFFDYNESKGWKVGSSPMKDWKAAIRTWEARQREARQQPSSAASRAKTVNDEIRARAQSHFEEMD